MIDRTQFATIHALTLALDDAAQAVDTDEVRRLAHAIRLVLCNLPIEDPAEDKDDDVRTEPPHESHPGLRTPDSFAEWRKTDNHYPDCPSRTDDGLDPGRCDCRERTAAAKRDILSATPEDRRTKGRP